jgi:formamidopyrimidine-DNA glycosylase
MPELPEVETVARDLQRVVAGATIRDATVSWDRTIRHPQPSEHFVVEVAGATIRRVDRRAKTVLLHMTDGRVMTVALRMTGALLVVPDGTPPDPYVRVAFGLTDGRELRYRDVRKFGRIGLWRGGGLRTVGAGRGSRSKRVAEGSGRYRIGEVFSGHGPEPLSRGFTVERLKERLARRSAKLKTLLLDQSFVAGVGNIYADEALFRAGIHPLRPAGRLRRAEIERLHAGIVEALERGIARQGASIDDYRDSNGERGSMQEEFLIHLRAGQPCIRCGRPVTKTVAAGRGTYVCRRCQPAPRPRRRAPAR